MAHRLSSLVLVAALAACDTGPGVSPQVLGACPNGMRKVAATREPFESFLFGKVPIFVEASGASADNPQRRLDLEDPKPLYGDAAGFDLLDGDYLLSDHAARAAKAGRSLVVGGRIEPKGPYADVVAAVDDDGDVAFVGACAYPDSQRLREFLAARGRPADVLRRMIAAGPSGPDAKALRALVRPDLSDWEKLPPDWRQIMGAPQQVRAALGSVSLSFRTPESWAGFRTTICQRLTIAVGECVMPEAGTLEATLLGYVEPGRDVVIEAKAPNGGWERLGPLVTVPHALVVSADAAKGLVLRLIGDPAIKDLDTLLRRGRDGPPPFTVTVVKR